MIVLFSMDFLSIAKSIRVVPLVNLIKYGGKNHKTTTKKGLIKMIQSLALSIKGVLLDSTKIIRILLLTGQVDFTMPKSQKLLDFAMLMTVSLLFLNCSSKY